MKIATTLLLALCVAFYLPRYAPAYMAAVMLLVAAYAFFDLTRVLERYRNLGRFVLVSLIVALLLIVPTLVEIQARLATAPYDHTHDSAIMIEEAIKFLLAGRNPYAENYAQTPMAQWIHFSGMASEENLALLYVPYLPLTFILPIPFHLAARQWLGFFDLRLFHIILFAIAYGVLLQLTQDWERKLSLAILVALQPLFTLYFIEGRNDVFVLFWCILTFYCVRQQRITLAAIALGLGCATKATAWFAVPFFLLHVWWIGDRNWRVLLARAVAPLVVSSSIATLPFLIWDARAFIAGTVLFHASLFHIWGQGLARLLVGVGIIPSENAPFPAAILQLVFGIPTLVVLARWQFAQPTVARMIAATAVLGLIVGYVSRTFSENISGFFLSLALIGLCLGEEPA